MMDAPIPDDPTALPDTYTQPTKRRRSEREENSRRRMSLNFTQRDYDALERLADVEMITTHEAIRRAVQTRWRVHTALHPELAFPDLPPDRRPEPAHLAFIGDVSGKVQILEIM